MDEKRNEATGVPDLDPADVRIETYCPTPRPQWVAHTDKGIRVTHIPTGITVEEHADRSQHRNKAVAYERLKVLVANQPAADTHAQALIDTVVKPQVARMDLAAATALATVRVALESCRASSYIDVDGDKVRRHIYDEALVARALEALPALQERRVASATPTTDRTLFGLPVVIDETVPPGVAEFHSGRRTERVDIAPASAQPADMADAYVGAREDMAIWKKRALEAEESCRRLTATLNAENGPTFMGEPVVRAQPDRGAAQDDERALFNEARQRIAEQVYAMRLPDAESEDQALFLLWKDGQRKAAAPSPASQLPGRPMNAVERNVILAAAEHLESLNEPIAENLRMVLEDTAAAQPVAKGKADAATVEDKTIAAGQEGAIAGEVSKLLDTVEMMAKVHECGVTMNVLDKLRVALRQSPATSAADTKDAARYRWLRNEAWGGHVMRYNFPHVVEFRPGMMRSAVTELAEEALDAAIDAAMAAAPSSEKGGEAGSELRNPV